jgi:hypothetical protein
MVKELKVICSDLVKTFSKKVSVFKITKQAQIQHDTHCEKSPACSWRLTSEYSPAPKKITADRKKQQYNEHTAGFKIKEQTDKQQVKGAKLAGAVNKRINQKYKQKETPKEELGKQ